MLLQEPIGQPTITGARDAIDLALFFIVAVAVEWLVASARAQRLRAEPHGSIFTLRLPLSRHHPVAAADAGAAQLAHKS